MLRTILLVFCGLLPAASANAVITDRSEVQAFMHSMAERHGFSEAELRETLADARIRDDVLEAISRPAEALPWYEYRKIFLREDRVNLGVAFWRENAAALERARDTYGVPPEIIVAILGVETRYGTNIGSYRVLDSLATLAFDYPRRSQFFLGELEQYLLMTREQGLDPREVRGSYAGAMGIPQFISSSYRRFAVDFDVDGATDIWNNPVDAIGSVGNYFRSHGWLRGGLIALPARVEEDAAAALRTDDLEPRLDGDTLAAHGVDPAIPLPPGEKVKLLELDAEFGKEYWLAFWNFYVITRYNHSAHYAMAVYRLAELIKQKKGA
jgi:membrane-bound lytic murein transglycosylase B